MYICVCIYIYIYIYISIYTWFHVSSIIVGIFSIGLFYVVIVYGNELHVATSMA